MSSIDLIVKKLNPLGIYDLTVGSNVYNELASYAYALDIHRANIETALRECFVTTAETYGIENRESSVGDVRSDYSIDDRRKMLILRRALGESDYTLSGFKNYLEAIGSQTYVIDEFCQDNKLVVSVIGNFSKKEEAWLKNKIQLLAPAHLDCILYINGVNWQTLDKKDLTFETLDSMDYKWTDILF